jgi:3-deoxy-D-manno-octulosonic-acid transferase
VWVHGASVGESLSHLPLVERFRAERPDVTVLVTSGTRTSAELLARRLPPGVIHQYAPVDAPAAARRFVGHWRPDLAVFVESELWPNLIIEAKAAGARLALVSGRVSPTSARNWNRAEGAARALLGDFDLLLPQDRLTGEWLTRHGATVGDRLDLKRLAEPLPFDPGELDRLKAQTAGRVVIVAASTHAGEEELLGDIVTRLPGDPLLVVVPRHPERGEAAAAALEAAGLRAARRSLGEAPVGRDGAYVADTLGELGLFYRLADVALIGGSLLPSMTGHNPWEAARLGKPLISGAHVGSFAEAYAELKARGAVLMAGGPAEFASAVAALVTEPEVAAALGERAREACAAEREGFDAAFARLLELLDR